MASFAVSSLTAVCRDPSGLGVTEVGLALILAAYGMQNQDGGADHRLHVISYWVPAVGFLAGGTTFLKSKEAEEAAEVSR